MVNMVKELLQIGQNVIYVDSMRKFHPALLTIIWGEDYLGEDGTRRFPCVNLVYVVDDESRQDQYGRQIERASSCVHFRDTTAPGDCWFLPEEEDEAFQAFCLMTARS